MNAKFYRRGFYICLALSFALVACTGWLLFGPNKPTDELAKQGSDIGEQLGSFSNSLDEHWEEYGELARRSGEIGEGYSGLVSEILDSGSGMASEVSGFGERSGAIAGGLSAVEAEIQGATRGLDSDREGLRGLSEEIDAYIREDAEATQPD